MLEAYDDVFSDIVNVLIFGGKDVIRPEELEERMPRTAYKAADRYHEMERDVVKRWKRKNIRVACIGFENQTEPDADMPLRVIGYDGAEYRAQLNEKTQKERYPVLTLVLYFGTKTHWNQPIQLLGCMQVPEELRPYISDYKINLFEIAYLDPDQIKLFKSDFGIIADYLVQKQRTGTYLGSIQEFAHVQETLSLLTAMSGDPRFEEALSVNRHKGREEIKTMCEVLDQIEARGIEIGEARGIEIGEARGEAKGLAEGAFRIASGLVKDGLLSAEEAAKRLGVTMEEFERKYRQSCN